MSWCTPRGAMDNPDLMVVAVVGDGEAETGPGRFMEGNLVPQPDEGWRRAADPSPQRREDLRPDRTRSKPPSEVRGCSKVTAIR